MRYWLILLCNKDVPFQQVVEGPYSLREAIVIKDHHEKNWGNEWDEIIITRDVNK